MLRRFFGRKARHGRVGSERVPTGSRVYAVGDVHGRLDLLELLLAKIDADDSSRPSAETTLIFLGDLIDRGPNSAGVIEALRHIAATAPRTRFLLGNHEQVFLASLAGDRRALQGFCRMGGRETILSYGLDAQTYERSDYDELASALKEIIPSEHRTFLDSFEDLIVLGDYAFVHAGIHPARALDAQRPEDLRWIREPFLSHTALFCKRIVHGHTPSAQVVWRRNRIGIDTGAYASGKLTALGLEDNTAWLIDT